MGRRKSQPRIGDAAKSRSSKGSRKCSAGSKSKQKKDGTVSRKHGVSLEYVRQRLHASAVPDKLPCRDDE